MGDTFPTRGCKRAENADLDPHGTKVGEPTQRVAGDGIGTRREGIWARLNGPEVWEG